MQRHHNYLDQGSPQILSQGLCWWKYYTLVFWKWSTEPEIYCLQHWDTHALKFMTKPLQEVWSTVHGIAEKRFWAFRSRSFNELGLANDSLWWSGSWIELQNPIYNIARESAQLVERCRQPDKLINNFIPWDSFIALCRYVPETEMSVLSLSPVESCLATTILGLTFKGAKMVT